MRLAVPLFFFLLLQLDLPGQSALRSAKAAQALLGPTTWSRVIRVENKNPRSVYPADEYALIFEFAGILWFYSESDGTQSFSLYTNRLAQEKADFGPGLRAIEPGFGAYSVVSDKVDVALGKSRFPNGCLIESIAAAREQFNRGGHVTAAKLVMFYATKRRKGHCVLAYETPAGVYLLDSGGSGKPRYFGRRWPTDSVELATAAWPEGRRTEIAQVRTLNCPIISNAPDETAAWASTAPASGSSENNPLADQGHG